MNTITIKFSHSDNNSFRALDTYSNSTYSNY